MLEVDTRVKYSKYERDASACGSGSLSWLSDLFQASVGLSYI